MLLPGDQILADRGFLLHEDFFLRDVQLITPAFTKGRMQLLHNEVESSRRISSSRIIVERAIGHIKKWRILTTTVPYHLVQNFDNIVTVAAGLTNLSPSLANKGEFYLHIVPTYSIFTTDPWQHYFLKKQLQFLFVSGHKSFFLWD